MVNFLTVKIVAGLVAGFLILSALSYDIYSFHRIKTLNQVIALQKQQIKQEQMYIKYYADLYAKLKKDCRLSKRQIIKHYSQLLKYATEPIPQIQIPQEPNQCKALKEMINEASNYFSK